ncbi:RNA 2'-phosphotransferase [Phenylobacterium sp.]|uniref:RNA 2'-phosphotransferase n=1 Tax=Phenylobacterium sp. TaxID=1871053 RepID=UPI002EDB3083
MSETEVSKYLSYILRHAPEAAGLSLDREGWAAIEEVLAGARRARKAFDRAFLQLVVDNNSKRRFEISPDGLRIRAVQGHSTSEVQRDYNPVEPPAQLFHGTAERFLVPIRVGGLKPGSRHHVHLSADEDTAVAVGRRHGRPVVLRVDAAGMRAAGHEFYQAENGVWLTASVPPQYLAER